MAEITELGEKEYNELISLHLQYQRDRKPAPLFTNAKMNAQQIKQQIENHPEFCTWTPEQAALLEIEIAKGFDEDTQKITRLTKYLKLDTWTPKQAAYLVSGIDPESVEINPIRDMLLLGWLMTDITLHTNATNLAGLPITANNSTAFNDAGRVLELWNSRENAPVKVRPTDFIAWCKTKNINTGWVTNADEWAAYAEPREALVNNAAVSQATTKLADGFDSAAFIPNRIAEILEPPMPYIEPVLRITGKRFLIEKKHYKYENLNDADLDLLESIFTADGLDFNDLINGQCTENHYEQFKVAFDSAKIKPEWEIVFKVIDPQAEAQVRRKNAINEHHKALEIAVKSGAVKIFSRLHIPSTTYEHDSIIRREDADAYIAGLGLALSDAPSLCTVAVNGGAGSHTATEPKKQKISKLEKQQAAILEVISGKGFNPMAIPDNEKGTIKMIVESDNDLLFKASTAFDRAWKKGIGTLWKMEYHEIYARRGNN